MADLIINVVALIVFALISGVLILVVKNPYMAHRNIHLKILMIISEYKDPRDNPVLATKIIGALLEMIYEVDGIIQEQKEIRPLFSKYVAYNEVQLYLSFILDYIRNPIMLPDQKEFDDDFRLDTNTCFGDLKKVSKFPIKKTMFILVLLFVFVCSLVSIVY